MRKKYIKPHSEIVKLNLSDSVLENSGIPIASGEIGHGQEESKPLVLEIEDDYDDEEDPDFRFKFSIWDDF